MADSNVRKTKRMIAENNYLTLATTNPDSTPWISTQYYAYDKKYNFYFISAKDSRHAKQIELNSKVVFTMFDSRIPPGKCDGVQIAGIAKVVGADELPKALEVLYRRRFPNPSVRARHKHLPSEFLGDSPRRVFKLKPTKIYTLDLTATKVDRRIEVEL